MPFSTYEQALAYWYGRINYEQSAPRPGDLKLDRMRALLHQLGNPHERFRIIHVAGSKGKGSTAAMLATILQRAGYRTGLFTSPHLCRVEERIQVDGVPISAAELTALLDDVRSAESEVRRRHSDVTFFEVGTALGFLHFARRRVDIAVVEVGLGGRFDSTNVCQPSIALITSISYDHTKLLGERLASIAFEKAGIVKAGRPTVSGVTRPEARQVIERVCRQRRSPLRQLGVDFCYEYEPGRVNAEVIQPRVRIETRQQRWPAMTLGLLGEHQAANAAVAVVCIEELRYQGMQVTDAAVRDGLAQVSWPARLEVVGRRPLVVLDCAHNDASMQALVQTLQTSFPAGRRLLVLAVSSDKDVAGILSILAPHFAHFYLTRFLGSRRSVPPEQMAEQLRQLEGVSATVHTTPVEAWQAAQAAAGVDDLICITGSVFLAGELRPLLLSPTATRDREQD
jgi:dihydrofolate synthase/folylpolyglutamate synthase